MPKELVRLASARLAGGRHKVGESSQSAAAAPAAAPAPDDDYLVHTLLPNPGVCDFLLLYPLAIATYFRRLARAFNIRFVLMVVAVYGFSQGAGESLEGFAEQYIFLDPAPRGYGVSASYYEALDALAGFPWICKAVYARLPAVGDGDHLRAEHGSLELWRSDGRVLGDGAPRDARRRRAARLCEHAVALRRRRCLCESDR